MGVYLAVQLRELRGCYGTGRDAAAVSKRLQHRLLPPVVRAHQRQRSRHIRRLNHTVRRVRQGSQTLWSLSMSGTRAANIRPCLGARPNVRCGYHSDGLRSPCAAPCTAAAARLPPMALEAAVALGVQAAHVSAHQLMASEPATPHGRPPPPASVPNVQVRGRIGSHFVSHVLLCMIVS